jgi:2-hydroxy-6-oxonona-2,4-dienedioate hydrolase
MAVTARGIKWRGMLAALFCLILGSHTHAQVGPNGEVDGLTAKFVDVNGIRTRYYDYGQGEAIVLVHGGDPGNVLSSSANTWARNIRPLARKFRVLALDRLGQGMTANPTDDGDFGVQAEVEHIHQFIRAMKLDKVHLVGHSTGGARVYHVALQHPEIVKTLTAVASAGGESAITASGESRLNAIVAKCPPADATNADSLRCRSMALAYSPSPEMFSTDFLKAQQWMANLPKAAEARNSVAAIRASGSQREATERDYVDRMRERARSGALQMPILIYGGKQDPLHWDVADAHALQREMGFFDVVGATNPRVKFIIINKCGHLPHREQPQQFNADLIQFIEFWNGKPKS